MGKIIGLVFPVDAPATDRIPCPHCNKDYATPEALARHINDKHPEQVQQ